MEDGMRATPTLSREKASEISEGLESLKGTARDYVRGYLKDVPRDGEGRLIMDEKDVMALFMEGMTTGSDVFSGLLVSAIPELREWSSELLTILETAYYTMARDA